MLLQSLRALYLAPGRPGSIWNYLQALVRSTGVSGRFAYGLRTDLHFADVSTALNVPLSVWNSLIPFWQTISIFFL